MNNYEVHYTVSGKSYKEVVTAENSYQARRIIQMRCPNAKITSITEV